MSVPFEWNGVSVMKLIYNLLILNNNAYLFLWAYPLLSEKVYKKYTIYGLFNDTGVYKLYILQ
jgi:hypothetical protein